MNLFKIFSCVFFSFYFINFFHNLTFFSLSQHDLALQIASEATILFPNNTNPFEMVFIWNCLNVEIKNISKLLGYIASELDKSALMCCNTKITKIVFVWSFFLRTFIRLMPSASYIVREFPVRKCFLYRFIYIIHDTGSVVRCRSSWLLLKLSYITMHGFEDGKIWIIIQSCVVYDFVSEVSNQGWKFSVFYDKYH